MKPTLHHPVPMNARVIIPDYYGPFVKTGTVVGVASMHVVFTYIVLLDKPHNDADFGLISAVVVNGAELEGVDGTNWRLTE